jgi:tryptophan synthase alpha chain
MPVSRIAATFERLKRERRAALIPFVTAGDPSIAQTVPVMEALVAGGADVIELGVPFSDPMADGPTIQRSSERALKNGMGLRKVLDAVRAFRAKNDTTPVVLMGYANPIEHMGLGAFVVAARAAGVDGVLIIDYPPEESAQWLAALEGSGIDPIFLLSPTSSDARIDAVAKVARGYIYYVSLKGVTGAAHIDAGGVATKIRHIRTRISVPVGVGFGIRDAQTARAIAAFADAVVIGSRIVEEIEQSKPEEAAGRVQALLAQIRAALETRTVAA